MHLKESLFKDRATDKIVTKEKSNLTLSTQDVVKMDVLNLVGRRQPDSIKKCSMLLTRKKLYYTTKVKKMESNTLMVEYKAYIALEWLQLRSYHEQRDDSTLIRYFIEIFKYPKRVKLQFECLEKYEAWLAHLSKWAIRTDFNEKYRLSKMIGKAADCSVYLIKDIRNSKSYTCRKFDRYRLSTTGRLAPLIEQINTLRQLKGHPNIIELHEVHETVDSVYLVTEYLKGDFVIQPKSQHDIADIRIIAKSLLEALKATHESGIGFVELKAQDILFKYKGLPISQNTIKFDDIGVLKYQDATEKFGRLDESVGYNPASYFPKTSNNCFESKSDVFALGIILYNAYTGSTLSYNPFNRSELSLDHENKFSNAMQLCQNFPDERKLISKDIFARFAC